MVVFHKELKMKISRSARYAILATCYITKNNDKKAILSQEIAKEYNIPFEYFLKVLQQLARTNILRSRRGPNGGFSLARPANKITMLEIIEAVDGPMSGKLYLIDHVPNDKFCIKAEKAYEKGITQEKAVFEKAKLSDLI
jgi:Rrf2 family protein